MAASGYFHTIATVGMTFTGMSVLTMNLWQTLGGQMTAELRPLCAVGMDDLEIHDQTNAVAMFANANRPIQTPGEPVEAA